MWEKPTPPLTGSPVRCGLTLIRMIMTSPMLEITTSVGTLLGLLIPSCGAIPTTLNMSVRIVQFHSAPPLRALDFSLDSDSKPDESNSYTHASLYKENLPSSFTICTSLMVEAWNKYVSAKVFFLHDNKGEGWHTLGIAAEATYTEFSLQFEDSPALSNQSKILFFPLQWTRVCLSVDAYTFLTRLVVDGELLVENEVKLKNEPDNLNLVLGSWTSPTSGNTYEYP